MLIGVLWISQLLACDWNWAVIGCQSSKTRHKKLLYICRFVVLYKGPHTNPAPQSYGTGVQKNSPRDHRPGTVF